MTKKYDPVRREMLNTNAKLILQILTESQEPWLSRKQLQKLSGIGLGICGDAISFLLHSGQIIDRCSDVKEYCVPNRVTVTPGKYFTDWRKGDLTAYAKQISSHMNLAMGVRR